MRVIGGCELCAIPTRTRLTLIQDQSLGAGARLRLSGSGSIGPLALVCVYLYRDHNTTSTLHQFINITTNIGWTREIEILVLRKHLL